MTETVNAGLDPAMANAAAAAFMGGGTADEPRPMPVAEPPADGQVTLLDGVWDITGAQYTQAVVRELTGADEEAMARTGGNLSKMFDLILERGVESIEDAKINKDTLGALLAGDRDLLLLAIRRVTFGDTIDLIALCPSCEQEQEVTLSLTDDVPVRELEGGRTFEVDLSAGKAVVNLPDGYCQRALAAADSKNYGVIKTTLLRHTVQSINGLPIINDDGVRKLSLRDRDLLFDEINKRTPGPRLTEVSRSCVHCSENIALPLTLTELFRL